MSDAKPKPERKICSEGKHTKTEEISSSEAIKRSAQKNIGAAYQKPNENISGSPVNSCFSSEAVKIGLRGRLRPPVPLFDGNGAAPARKITIASPALKGLALPEIDIRLYQAKAGFEEINTAPRLNATSTSINPGTIFGPLHSPIASTSHVTTTASKSKPAKTAAKLQNRNKPVATCCKDHNVNAKSEEIKRAQTPAKDTAFIFASIDNHVSIAKNIMATDNKISSSQSRVASDPKSKRTQVEGASPSHNKHSHGVHDAVATKGGARVQCLVSIPSNPPVLLGNRKKRQRAKVKGNSRKKRKIKEVMDRDQTADNESGEEEEDEEMEQETVDSNPVRRGRTKLPKDEQKRRNNIRSCNVSRLQSCIMKLWLIGKTCVNCGNSDVDILQNDHTKSDKMRTKDLSRVVPIRQTHPSKMGKELRKCEPVCPICHAIRTNERRPPSKTVSSAVLAMRAKVNLEKAKRGCCEFCRIPFDRHLPYVFEFDHRYPATKIADISTMAKRPYKYSWAQILQEIEKCRLLCTNCHQKHTRDMALFYGKKWLDWRDFTKKEKAMAKIYLNGTVEEIAALSRIRAVAQINKITGKVVRVFHSCSEAARAILPNDPKAAGAAIWRCLHGKQDEYKNYLWKKPSPEDLKRLLDEDDAVIASPSFISTLKGKRKQVVKVDRTTGEILDIYLSIYEAASSIILCAQSTDATPDQLAAVRIAATSIGSCVNGKQPTAYGFFWEELHPDHLFLLDGFLFVPR